MKDKQQEQKRISNSSIQKEYDIRYPREICRFDDDFPHISLMSVRDPKILNKLKQKCEEAKILWEATDLDRFYFGDVFDQGGSPTLIQPHYKQFLVYLHLAVSYAKLLASDGRLNRHRSLLSDRNAVNDCYEDSFSKARYCLDSYKSKYDINFCHPFAKLILSCSPDIALKGVQSSNYKKEEGLFIRTCNSDRQIILKTITEKLAHNKNIVIHRFQVSTQLTPSHGECISSDHFKSDLNIVLDRIRSLSKNNLLCAVHSLFPSALSQTGLQGFEGTIGHLVLLFSKNVLKQNKLLLLDLQNSFLLNDGTALQTSAIDPAKNGYRSKAVGNMSTSSPRQGFEQMADYMTLERRYIRPGFRIPSVASFPPCLKQQHTISVKKFI